MRAEYRFPHGDYLSPSQINEYLSCPACFQMSRLDRIPKKTSISLHIGGLVHKAVEDMRKKLLSGMVSSVEQESYSIQAAADHFDRSLEIEEGDIDVGMYGGVGEAKDHVIELTTFLLPQIAELDQQRGLVAAELDLQDFQNPWPFPMRGRVDVLYGPEPDLCNSGADLKTSSRQLAPDFAAALQVGIYRSFLPVAWFADVVAKTKLPSFQSYTLSEDGDDFVRHVVLDVADRICRGDFPARPGFRCKYPHGTPTFYATVSMPGVTDD